jgi:hypothetical protein
MIRLSRILFVLRVVRRVGLPCFPPLLALLWRTEPCWILRTDLSFPPRLRALGRFYSGLLLPFRKSRFTQTTGVHYKFSYVVHIKFTLSTAILLWHTACTARTFASISNHHIATLEVAFQNGLRVYFSRKKLIILSTMVSKVDRNVDFRDFKKKIATVATSRLSIFRGFCCGFCFCLYFTRPVLFSSPVFVTLRRGTQDSIQAYSFKSKHCKWTCIQSYCSRKYLLRLAS